MAACLHVVGLGPAGLDQMTVGDFKRLRQAKKIFVRTKQHPCVQELLDEGISLESFDEIYAAKESFEEVYEEIINRLRSELERTDEVIYAVPGHPSVAEKTVQLIEQRLSGEVEIIIHPAVSFLDQIFRAIPFDPIDGLLVLNYDALKQLSLSGREWLVVPQVYNRLLASEVKLDLMKAYPDDASVYIVQALGSSGEMVEKVYLHELDHLEFDHLSTVVVPPNDSVISWPKLAEVMKTLRSPEGCPWDREQTHETLRQYLIEESYEVIQAIDNQDMYNLCEELGDLLLQVVFHSQLAAEHGEFEVQDVLQGIIEKLIRRHPHVFGGGQARNSGEVIKTWEKIKQEEKSEDDGVQDYFAGSKGFPALMMAAWTQKKVAQVGFDWPDRQGPWEKVNEELRELEEALQQNDGKDEIREELGDLFFSIVNLSRFLDLDAEIVLWESVQKFQNRFRQMMKLAKVDEVDFEKLSLPEMDSYWEKAKTAEKCGKVSGV